MTTPIPIPDDATAAQVQQLIDTASEWLVEHRCPAYLSPGPQCQAGIAPHTEHFAQTLGAGADGVVLPLTIRWTDPVPPPEG